MPWQWLAILLPAYQELRQLTEPKVVDSRSRRF
jgi:hypothetical protein